MLAPKKAAAGGSKYFFIGFLDEQGFLIGGTPDAPAAGATGSSMLHVRGIQSAAPTILEGEAMQILGDDDLIGEIPLTSIASRRFTAQVAIQDLDLDADLQGTNVETLGEVQLGVLDTDSDTLLDSCLILQSRALKQDDGVRGKKAWQGVILPLANAQPRGRAAYASREAAAFNLDITPQQASYNPWGITLLAANAGATGVRLRPFHSEFPIVMERFTGDGVTTTFNLTYEPISVAKTTAVVNRVAATVSSISAANKTVTLNSAPAIGAKVVFFLEFQP